MEILIVLLMFAFPVAAAVIGKKNQEKKNVPPVVARPLTEIFRPEEEGMPALRKREDRKKEDKVKTVQKAQAAKTVAPVTEEMEEAGKFTEKQKLIIYSEILKPKFDE